MSGQTIATIGIVVIAIGLLAARLRRLIRGGGTGCGSCDSCAVPRGGTVTPLVPLGNGHSWKPEQPASGGQQQSAGST